VARPRKFCLVGNQALQLSIINKFAESNYHIAVGSRCFWSPSNIIHTFDNQNFLMTRFTTNANRFDPYKNFRFRVKMDGKVVAGIAEVTGIPITEVSKSKYNKTKQPGLTKFANVTLKRGITSDTDFLNWVNSAATHGKSNAENKKSLQKDVAIELLDEDGKVVLSYLLKRVWISKITGPNLNAKGNEVAIETIELQHEGLEVTRC
jgi:phage tail-like protein